MPRLAKPLAVACVTSAALLLPAGAGADPEMICPDEFQPTTLQIYPPGTDKNGNFIVCVKDTNGTVIFRDDLEKLEE